MANGSGKVRAAAAIERRLAFLALALACLAPHFLGWRFPDAWWGSHFLAFIPRTWALTTVGIALSLAIFHPNLEAAARRLGKKLPRVPLRPLVLAILLALAYAFGCYTLDMATDIYGDARRNLAAVEMSVERGNPNWARNIFNPNLLFREGGDHFVIGILGLLAAKLGISARNAFGLFNALFGLLFAFTWIRFVQEQQARRSELVLFGAAGLLAGFAPLFTDHAEVYAPALCFLLLFLVTAIRCLRTRRRALFWWLPLLYILAVKSHFANLLLALPMLLVGLELFVGTKAPLLTRRRSLLFVALPLFLAFLGIYFLVMKNHAVSRFVDDIGRAKTFFLPLLDVETNGAPRYTLLSRHHLADFLNLMTLWSMPALLLTLFAWLFRRRQLAGSPPTLVIVELTLLVYVGVFFATNPVIGMPRDWDLFMIPTVPLLIYAVLLVGRAGKGEALPGRLVGVGFALLVLALPGLAINHSPALLAGRVESNGVISYQRYWKGAGYMLNVAAELGETDEGRRQERRLRSYRRIRPFALPADAQLADLALRISESFRNRGQYGRARPFARDALRSSRGNALCVKEMVLVQFGQGEFDEALANAMALHESQPRNPVYLDLAFKSAFRAERWRAALELGERYQDLQPQDSAITDLLRRVRSQLPSPSP